MSPLTINATTAIQHARQVREVEQRRVRTNDRAVQAARVARAALERAGW